MKTNATPNPYAHIFDENIYNQPPSIRKYVNYESIDNKEVQGAAIQLLIANKVECLERRLFSKLDKELQDIKGLMSDNKVSAGAKITKAMGTFFATASGLALFAFPVGGAAAATVSRFAIGATITGMAGGAGLMGASEFLLPDGQVDLHKITTAIERQKQELILKLIQEPIFDLEVKYVIRKRFYENPLLEKEIEKTLIMSRVEGFLPLNFQREFLENCLRLPLQKKQIDLSIPWWNLMRDVELESSHLQIGDLQENVLRKKLTYYDETVRSSLAEAIFQISASSMPGAKSVKRFYYFWGLPGLGKSEAAKLIPDYLA